MDRAAQRSRWEHTSWLLSWIEQNAAFRKGKPRRPDQLNPLRARAPAAREALRLSPRDSVSALAAAFGIKATRVS